MRLLFQDGDHLREAVVTPLPDGRHRVVVDGGAALELRLERRGDAIELRLAGDASRGEGQETTMRAWVTRDGKHRFVTAPGVADVRLESVDGRRAARADDHAPEIVSPMPGRVVKVLVAEGDDVTRGQPLVVVEAMKTELTIAAPRAGRVGRVHAVAGQSCEAGKPLVEM